MAQEYHRRLSQSRSGDVLEVQGKQLALALKRLKVQEDRLIDAYKNEAIDLAQLKEEMGKLKVRREELERQGTELDKRARQQANAQEALRNLEAFCQRVALGLESLTFEERQKLLRLLVDRILVVGERVRIEGVIPLDGHRDSVLCPTRPAH